MVAYSYYNGFLSYTYSLPYKTTYLLTVNAYLKKSIVF